MSDGPRGFFVISGRPEFLRKYNIDNGTATAVFIGDLMKLETDGKAAVMAAASDDYLGVVVALFDADGKPVKTLAASTAGSVILQTDPNALLLVQAESGTALTEAAIGDCADAIWTHAGDTGTGRAGVELDNSLVGNGNSAQFRVLDKADFPDNAWGDTNMKVIVQANEHALKASHVAI